MMANSTIITGQYVRINQVPASVGERILACAIDYILLALYVLGIIKLIFPLYRADTSNDVVLIFFVGFLLLAVGYSLLCEVFNRGQSLGKRLLRIRVVKTDGSTPTFGSYLLRWLLYLIDVPFTGGLGVIFVLFTKNGQRIGDLAAGTMVIKENDYRKIHVTLDEFNYLTESYRPAYPQAADLSLEQINVIWKALSERSHKKRERYVIQLAGKIRSLLSIAQPAAGNDEEFLHTLVRDYRYYALEEV